MIAHALTPPRPGAPDPPFLPDLGTAFARHLLGLLSAGHALRPALQGLADRDLDDPDGPFADWEFDFGRLRALEEALAGLAEAEIPAAAWDWLAPRLDAFRARTRSFPGQLPGMAAWDTEMTRMAEAVAAVQAGRRDADGLALLGRRLLTLWS